MQFSCPHCGKSYQNSMNVAGRRVSCKACGGTFTAPALTPSPAPDELVEATLVSTATNTTLDGDHEFLAGNVEIQSTPVTMRGGQSYDGRSRTADEIDYEIFGHEAQYVEITLDPREQTIAEAGALMYMTDGVQMETVFGDPSQQHKGFLGKALSAGKRVLTGESLFMTTFTNQGRGHGAKRELRHSVCGRFEKRLLRW